MIHQYIYVAEKDGIERQLKERKIPYRFIKRSEIPKELHEKLVHDPWFYWNYFEKEPKRDMRFRRNYIEVDISEEEFETLRRNCYPGHADKKEG